MRGVHEKGQLSCPRDNPMPVDQPLRRYLLPITVFAITMGVGLWFMGLSQTNRINESRLERFHLLSDIRSEIERRIAVTLTSTEILAHEVESAKGHPDDFNFLAQRILDQIGGINNLQLSPNGIVRSIHPLAGNVEALGHNILGDKQRNAEAIASVGSGLMTLAGPIKLVQGGIAVIARKPVYLWADGIRPVNMIDHEGRPPFWGFVSALIMLDELIDSPTLASLADKGYNYHFSRINPRKNTQVEFAKSGEFNEAWSDTIDIRVPNDEWTLTIGNNTAIGTSQAAVELAASLLLASLLAILTWFSLQRREVEAQTISAD